MSGVIISLIVQLIGGAIGGNGIGAAMKNINRGPAGNTVAGALGGGVSGAIVRRLSAWS